MHFQLKTEAGHISPKSYNVISTKFVFSLDISSHLTGAWLYLKPLITSSELIHPAANILDLWHKVTVALLDNSE